MKKFKVVRNRFFNGSSQIREEVAFSSDMTKEVIKGIIDTNVDESMFFVSRDYKIPTVRDIANVLKYDYLQCSLMELRELCEELYEEIREEIYKIEVSY